MINWGLAGQNNALNMFQFGAQLGQSLRTRQRERQTDEALAIYAANPDAPEGVNALLRVDPRLAIQVQGQQAQRAKQAREQQRADLPLMERLLTMAQDEPSYQQARQAAQQYGIDTSQLPPTFDPAWRDQQLATVKLLNTPQGQEALSTAGRMAVDMGFKPGTPEFSAKVTELWQVESTKFLATQPGGGVASVAPGQPAQFVIQPNDGSQPAGAPVGSVPPPPAGFVLDPGGPAPAPGNFRP